MEEGSVGAGTGTMAFGWKGGIGTSSRRVPLGEGGAATVGVLVQTNFGGRLTIDGVPVWKHLPAPQRAGLGGQRDGGTQGRLAAGDAGGSCMIVVATDAPLDARQLRRLAARAMHGMARTGASGSQGSGDYVIAFSTTNRIRGSSSRAAVADAPISSGALLRDDELSPLFQAVSDATEEAIYNSLLRATTVRGRDGHTAEAILIEPLRRLLSSKK